LETGVAGKIQVMGIEDELASRPAQNGDFAVIHPDLLRHAVKIFEGVLMAQRKCSKVSASVNSRYILRL